MKQTIFAILTNKKIRKSRVVEKALDKEFAAGAPWLKSGVELPDAKIAIAS
jgi:hypothetical protein